MITWEQATIKESKTKEVPIPIYIGYVENLERPVLKIELDYRTGEGFKDQWRIDVLGEKAAMVPGTIHEAERIKIAALNHLHNLIAVINSDIN